MSSSRTLIADDHEIIRRGIRMIVETLLFGPSRADEIKNPIDALSDRELAVVEYTTSGMSAKAIAHKMNLDISTSELSC